MDFVPPQAEAAIQGVASLFFQQSAALLSRGGEIGSLADLLPQWAGFGLEVEDGQWRMVLYLNASALSVVPQDLLNQARQAATLLGIPLITRQTGPFRMLQGGLPGGASIGARYDDPTSGQPIGSLGAYVRWKGQVYMLSCNHVLSINDEVRSRPQGAEVLSPARNGAVVGETERIPKIFFRRSPPNVGDWALARLVPGMALPRWWQGPPNLLPAPPVDPGLLANRKVVKFGATTGRTEGTVAGLRQGFCLSYAELSTMLDFEGQLRVRSTQGAFARDGDSGSLVVTDTGEAVGLVFATDGLDTLVCPLKPLFDQLQLTLELPS